MKSIFPNKSVLRFGMIILQKPLLHEKHSLLPPIESDPHGLQPRQIPQRAIYISHRRICQPQIIINE